MVSANTQYWTQHTVANKEFLSREDSLAFVQWRNGLNLFREELMPVAGHDGKDILDYGCGTGNGLVNLLEFSKPNSIVGADISPTAIELSRKRATLHDTHGCVSFQLLQDGTSKLPFADNSFDFIMSDGVLHHTPNPGEILAEFKRILRPRGECRIYVYNYNSIWLHYYVAFQKRVVEGLYRDQTIRQAFRRCTDGPECPISNCYTAEEFLGLCRDSGLDGARFAGAGIVYNEMIWVQDRFRAIASMDLEQEHRMFLRSLEFDSHGRPLTDGAVAGSAGFYSYIKP